MVRNVANRSKIVQLSLQDMVYHIHLTNKSPLFLQLSQCFTGKVDAVIPNAPEAALMAEKMKFQIAAWCHFYWKTTNPGEENFFKKLSERAFDQVLIHEISNYKWDVELMLVSLPNAQSEFSAAMEFENQDWVKNIAQANQTNLKQKWHVNPNAAFPFEDDFSVGTIHGKNMVPHRNPRIRGRIRPPRIQLRSSRSMTMGMTSAYSCQRHSKNSSPSLFRKGIRVKPP
jgi:hypothetical protein